MGSDKIRVEPIALQPRNGGYQFSGYNALGCLVAYAKVHDEAVLQRSFDFGQITPVNQRNVSRIVRKLSKKPSIVLLSCYVWNHATNMEFAKKLKQRQPHALIVVGGPHVPSKPKPCQEFFDTHPFIDIAVRHEGEITLAELLCAVQNSQIDLTDFSQVDFSKVAGLTYRKEDQLIRTLDRLRTKDLSCFPSPFVTGEFDHWFTGRSMIPIETNRGCPYGCTYCDWGSATLAKLHVMDIDRVKAEIEFAAKHRVDQIMICDANFGILPRDIDITQYVIQIKARHGYPKRMPYASAKTVTPRVKEVMKTAFDSGLHDIAPISIQTTDQGVLDNIERSNIKLEEYDKLLKFLHKEGIPANSDMMVGLPGQTLETCKNDLQFFFDRNVLAVHFRTSVMPNAPLADEDYLRRFEIVIDENSMIESCYSFTIDEHRKMLELCLAYKLFVKIGILKYFLYHVQLEHGVKAMDFVAKWIDEVSDVTTKYPISNRIWRNLLNCDCSTMAGNDWMMIRWSHKQARFLFNNVEAFHREILKFFEFEHDVSLYDSAVDSVLTANRVVMPKKGRRYPVSVNLLHDVVGYFADIGSASTVDKLPVGIKPLGQRKPGKIKLPEQRQKSIRSIIRGEYAFFDSRLADSDWELRSNLRLRQKQ